MGYQLEGRLLEVCDCRVLCPCWIGEDPDGKAEGRAQRSARLLAAARVLAEPHSLAIKRSLFQQSPRSASGSSLRWK